jgi:hypothetical protein
MDTGSAGAEQAEHKSMAARVNAKIRALERAMVRFKAASWGKFKSTMYYNPSGGGKARHGKTCHNFI